MARWHKRFWLWLKAQVVSDVPEHDGLCEFECRKPDCKEEEWANCERRIQKAAGELWPARVDRRSTQDHKVSETSNPTPEAQRRVA